MLVRNRLLTHRLGGSVDLPLLVPSFTSKGFPFYKEGRGRKARDYSETARTLKLLGSYLTESMLISAYDLHHGHYPRPETYLRIPNLLFLDSGAYELSDDFDSSEPKLLAHEPKPFTAADYENLLGSLASSAPDIRCVITNFDWATRKQPLSEQIAAARHLFNRFPKWSNSFIIKPGAGSRYIDVDALVPHIDNLRGFDVIGVTEKELGLDLLDKLKRIARLCVELKRRSISAPLHIWGGLDPLITPLYFFAGAEIFDGVSWLRYSYSRGLAVNRECYAVLNGTITTPRAHAVGMAHNENIFALRRLATNLRAFADAESPSFAVFEENAAVLEKAFRTMCTKIDEL